MRTMLWDMFIADFLVVTEDDMQEAALSLHRPLRAVLLHLVVGLLPLGTEDVAQKPTEGRA